MSGHDIFKHVAYEILNRLFSYMTEKDYSVEDLSNILKIKSDKLDNWFDGEELLDADELGRMEDFLDNNGKINRYPIEKQYIIKKLDEYRTTNDISYSKLKKEIGLKSKSAIHYWVIGEKEPSDKYIEKLKNILSEILAEHKDVKKSIKLIKDNQSLIL